MLTPMPRRGAEGGVAGFTARDGSWRRKPSPGNAPVAASRPVYRRHGDARLEAPADGGGLELDERAGKVDMTGARVECSSLCSTHRRRPYFLNIGIGR